jgi:multicomponent Na+:H+ antiporter subunit E
VEAAGTMRTAKTALALFLFWCVLVPPRAAWQPLLGAVAAVAVAAASLRFWGPRDAPLFSVVRPLRAPGFLARTGRRIVTSAWQVLRIVLDPRLPVAPEVIEQEVRFEQEAARVAYANVITLTPGTVTVDVRGDTFVVHCLDPRLAGDVTRGTLARDVARLFGETRFGGARLSGSPSDRTPPGAGR